MLSKVFSLDSLSCPQIWNVEQEKYRERESKGQAIETQREKVRQRSKVRDKKRTKETFFVGRTTLKLCSGVDKGEMPAATNARRK